MTYFGDILRVILMLQCLEQREGKTWTTNKQGEGWFSLASSYNVIFSEEGTFVGCSQTQ